MQASPRFEVSVNTYRIYLSEVKLQ
jgi:hypothetical protein